MLLILTSSRAARVVVLVSESGRSFWGTVRNIQAEYKAALRSSCERLPAGIEHSYLDTLR